MQYKGAVQVARRSDMDMNGHINNVTYVAWALETVPIDVYLNYTLVQVTFLHHICDLSQAFSYGGFECIEHPPKSALLAGNAIYSCDHLSDHCA